MGASSSSFLTGSEAELLSSLCGDASWSIDDERWDGVLRFKVHPWQVSYAYLANGLAPYAARFAENDGKSHNLSTLASVIASRLPRTANFYRTDVEQSISGVMLLRVFARSVLGAGGPAALFAALGRSVNGPARGAAAPAGSWVSLITASVAFLAGGCAPGAVHALTYELHAQVASLLLTLLGGGGGGGKRAALPGGGATGTGAGAAGVSGGEDVLHHIPASAAAGADGGLEGAAAAGGPDAALKAIMLLGARSLDGGGVDGWSKAAAKGGGSGAGGSGGAPEAGATWAGALVAALLRNVAVDGARSEDSDLAGPSADSAAGKASLAVVAQRAAALEAYAKGALEGGEGGEGGGGGAGKPRATSAALDAVADLASSALRMPGAIVGKLLEDSPDPVGKPLAERSALLLLLLVHNLRAVGDALLANPYREALKRLVDSGASSSTYAIPLPAPGALAKGTPVAARPLFTALVALSEQPLGVCLLYTLLQVSEEWCKHVLSRADVDALLLPLLNQLYCVPTLGPDHRYILLITLLLFTQDAAFCETAHRRVKVPSRSVTWFRERNLGDISLGSLLLTCVMRTVAVTSGLSVYSQSDSYLHTNCFAAAANMAPYSEGLHSYAAQRTLATLSLLHRKYKRHAALLAELGAPHPPPTHAGAAVHAPAHAAHAGHHLPPNASEEADRLKGLLHHFEQCLRIGCETLLACCAPASLSRNVALLYALLHDRAVVDELSEDHVFADVARPLKDVVTHFAGAVALAQSARALALAQSGSGGAGEVAEAAAEVAAGGGGEGSGRRVIPWSERDVTKELVAAAKNWKGGEEATKAASSLAETKFEYEEDVNPELFFVPYVQGLIAAYTADLGATCNLYTAGKTA